MPDPVRRSSAFNMSGGATAIHAPKIATVSAKRNGLEGRRPPAGRSPQRPASRSRRPATAAAGPRSRSRPATAHAWGASDVQRAKLVAIAGRGNTAALKPRPQTSRRDRGPGRAGAFRPQKAPPTMFRRFYDRGDLPLCISFRGAVRKVQWKVSLNEIDYAYYLPVFMDGLRETQEPYKFLAEQGTMELLERGKEQILPCIPSLILPLKTNFATKQPKIVATCLRVLQKLATSSALAGVALVQYYRQLLGVCNLFAAKRVNLGDAIDYAQHRQEDLGVLIAETLEVLERTGGEDARVNLVYMIPTWG